MGTGSKQAETPPKYRDKGVCCDTAAARATAIDTARIAFAPKRPLLGVPSSESINRSICDCRSASVPT